MTAGTPGWRGPVDHRAVDELDRGRLQLDDVLGAVHRPVEALEVDHAQRLVARQRRQTEGQALRDGQRALAADQQVGEVTELSGV